MPSDSSKKARIVVDRALVDQVQAEASRRGLGEKSASALADMIFRAWLRSGLSAASPAVAPEAVEDEFSARLAAIEKRLSALDRLPGRVLALEDRQRTLAGQIEATGYLTNTERLLPGPSKASKGRGSRTAPERPPRGPIKASSGRPAGEGGAGYSADTLRQAMERAKLSQNSLGGALGYKDKGRTVGKWLGGKAPIPAKHQDKLAELLGDFVALGETESPAKS